MAEQKLELTVQVNSETGQLEVVQGKLAATGRAAESASGSFSGLSKSGKELLGALGLVASSAGIIKFFADSVKQAEEETQAIRRLTAAFGESAESVKAWGQTIQQTTRFSDSQAIGAVEKLARVTKDLSQAQAAAKLAMDISVSSGRDLAAVQELLFDLINGNNRAIIQARNEFGSLINKTDTTQQAIDKLIQKFAGAAEQEQSLTSESAKLQHAIEDLQKQIGGALNPGLTTMVGWLEKGVGFVQKMGVGLATLGVIAVDPKNFENAIKVANEELEKLDQKQKEIEDRKNSAAAKPPPKPNIETQETLNREIELIVLKASLERQAAENEIKLQKEVSEEIRKDNEARHNEIKNYAKKNAEAIASNFSQSMADVILGSKNFEEAMVGVFKNIEAQIASAIIQLIVFKSIATAIGGPFGGFLPFGAPGSGGGPRGTISGSGSAGLLGANGQPLGAPTAQNINVTVATNSLDITNAPVILDALAREIAAKTSSAERFAVLSASLAGRNSGRAV